MRQRLLVKVTREVHTSLVTLFGQRPVVTRIAVAGRDLNQRPFAHRLSNLCIHTPTIHSMINTLWTIDRLWVRYLKQLDFYEFKQLLETRLIEVTPFPVDILIHYHTVEWNNGILAFIKLHHILVVTFKCLINLRHGIDNFSSPPFKKSSQS